MKKLFFALVALIATSTIFTSCDKDTEMVADFSTLPTAAQTTITEHFDEDQVMLVIYDKEIFDKEYVVTLFDGTIIEFDKNGVWESIESPTTGVPTSIIPATIAEYLATNFAAQKVIEIDKDSDTKGYDVKLDNLIELEFNSAGALVGVDND